LSSPTINVNPSTGGGFSDTSFLTIMNLARSLVNDTQAGINGVPGEGQVLTNSPTVSHSPFRSSIQRYAPSIVNCETVATPR